MSDGFENDDWDNEALSSNLLERYKVPAIGLAVVLAAFLGVGMLSTGDTYETVRVSYLKGEYSDVISASESLLLEVDEYMGAEINLLLSKVYADKSGDFYDLSEALRYLEQSFTIQPTKTLANTALLYIDELGYPKKSKIPYLEYLSKDKDAEAAKQLVVIYSSMPTMRERVKAKEHVGRMADTLENKVLLAGLYLDRNSGLFHQSNAMKLLASAANSGSPEALFLMAKQNLIIAKSSPKIAGKLLGEYPSLVARAVRLGYRGKDVHEAIEIIKFGRDGVLRNVSLAKELKTLVEND